MESLDTLWSKYFIKNLDFVWNFMRYLQETFWKFSYIHQSNLQVLSQVWVLVMIHQSGDHEFDNSWLFSLVKLVYNLFLSIKMDWATHDDKRSIEGVLVWVSVLFIKEPTWAFDHFIVNAFLLTLMVHTDVT